jgi:hypothetical protein
MNVKRNRYLVLGIFVTSTVGVLTTSITVAIAGDDPICYMQNRDGRQLDLSKLCDRPTPANSPTTTTNKSQPSANTSHSPLDRGTIEKIDPKAPIKIPRVVTDKPPDFWYQVPDLPHPPFKGRTSDSP